MRGRTNTNLFSGAPLNAEIGKGLVADGETIIPGDFVDYKPASIGSKIVNKDQIPDSVGTAFVDKLSNGYLLVITNIARVYKYEDKEYTLVVNDDSINNIGKPFSEVMSLGNDCYAMLSVYQVSGTKKLTIDAVIFKFNIIDNTFEIKRESINCNTELEKSGYPTILSKGNKFYLFILGVEKSYTGNYDTYYFGGTFPCSGDSFDNYTFGNSSYLSKVVSTYVASSSKLPTTQYKKPYVIFTNSKNGFVLAESYHPKNTSQQVYFIPLNRLSGNLIWAFPSTYFSDMVPILEKNSVVFFVDKQGTAPTYVNTLTISRIKVNFEDYSHLDIGSLVVINKNIIWAKEVNCFLLNENENKTLLYLYVRNNRNNCVKVLLNIDNESSDILASEEIIQELPDVDNDLISIYKNENEKFVSLESCIINNEPAFRGLIDYSYHNNVLISETGDFNIIRRIFRKDNIKGVAKEHGIAGDIIDIYLPLTEY